MPRVSIIYLTYNQAAFVEASLESLCQQDWADLEVVVGDDASTDDTPRIIRELAARYPGRVKLALSEQNGGIARNINRALALATGDYVAFCGGDDLFLRHKVARQVAWFESHPRGVLCAHDVEYFRDNQTIGRHSELIAPQTGRGAGVLIRRGNIFHAIAVMVRRSCIPAYGADERLPFLNDYKMWIDCLVSGGEYEILPDTLARYRRSNTNVTKVHREKMLREETLVLDILEAEHPGLAADIRRGRAQLHYRNAIWNLRDNPREARELALTSLRLSPNAKLPALIAATLLPAPLRHALLDWRSGRSQLHA